MEASQPFPVTVDVAHAQSPLTDLVAGHVASAIAQGTTTHVRKRHGNVIVQGGNPVGPAGKARFRLAPPGRQARVIFLAATGEEGQGFEREVQEGSYEKADDFILSIHPSKWYPDDALQRHCFHRKQGV
ncbi:hypothetical protein D1007_30283 [Hordeum vulgare]|nr:hypothetical protein D1007_30283 [Hordeum vulgare]